MEKKQTSSGRSMVEMLGVLAIIAVLTIMGLLGYKRAMVKVHTNEAMHLMNMTYNAALAKAMHHPSNIKVSELESNGSSPDKFRLYARGYASTTESVAADPGNAGFDKPGWAKTASFNIYVNLVPETSKTYANQSYHYVYFMGVSSDICEELRTRTTWVSGQLYRELPGTKKDTPDPFTKGIRVYCRTGTSSGTSWWKTSDTN